MKALASAPGKVILFGEHAVVYGVTAIAAALSDLRIVVEASTTNTGYVEVILHDIISTCSSDANTDSKIDCASLVGKFKKSTPDKAAIPTAEDIESLTAAFKSSDINHRKALMAIIYLVCNIIPEVLEGHSRDDHSGNSSAGNATGLLIEVRSVSLPVGAGLGSSAAFSVAVTGALMRLRSLLFPGYMGIPPPSATASLPLSPLSSRPLPFAFASEASSPSPSSSSSSSSPSSNSGTEIVCEEGFAGIRPSPAVLSTLNDWAFTAEVILHGKPSGLDNTVSCMGGAIRYNRGENGTSRVVPLPSLPPLSILLTNTRVPRETSALVAGVRRMHEAFPGVTTPVFQAIEGISQAFLELTAAYVQATASMKASGNGSTHADEHATSSAARVGQLMSMNHGLLCALGVGHPALDAVVEASRSVGLAAKLTGAGGGGCALTLLRSPSHESSAQLQTKLRSHGFDDFTSAMGGPGVLWHTAELKAPVRSKSEGNASLPPESDCDSDNGDCDDGLRIFGANWTTAVFIAVLGAGAYAANRFRYHDFNVLSE